MKILCVIDSLGSGGAQRQMATLAVGLKKRGHQVRFLLYHENNHFLPLLEVEKIECQVIQPMSHFNRVFEVRKIIRKGWQDVVLAFLEGSIFYSELAHIPNSNWGLVVGERSANPAINKGARPWFRQFHRFADYVVCNSYTNQLMLEKIFPFLRDKIFTVYNTVDMKRFGVDTKREALRADQKMPIRIVVAASYHENKNMINVAKAVFELQKRTDQRFIIDWYGAVQNDKAPYENVLSFIKDNQIGHIMRLHDKIREIDKEMKNADVVGLFSFFEGLPNVVCEGMACGKPILMSGVCDASNLVIEGKNGFLCDPHSPHDIASKIQRFLQMGNSERSAMGRESRRMAEELFENSVIIERYEKILNASRRKDRLQKGCSWPSHIPETAISTVKSW